MKNPFVYFFLFLVLLTACNPNKQLVKIQTDNFRLSINSKGYITELTDIAGNQNYLSIDTIAPLLSCQVNGKMLYPVAATD